MMANNSTTSEIKLYTQLTCHISLTHLGSLCSLPVVPVTCFLGTAPCFGERNTHLCSAVFFYKGGTL